MFSCGKVCDNSDFSFFVLFVWHTRWIFYEGFILNIDTKKHSFEQKTNTGNHHIIVTGSYFSWIFKMALIYLCTIALIFCSYTLHKNHKNGRNMIPRFYMSSHQCKNNDMTQKYTHTYTNTQNRHTKHEMTDRLRYLQSPLSFWFHLASCSRSLLHVCLCVCR